MSFSADFADQDRAALLGDDNYAGAYEPGFFDGSMLGGIGRGIVSGPTQLALQAAQYGNDPTQAILLDVPTDEEEMTRRAAIGEQRLQFAKSIRPSAEANGKATQLLFDLSDVTSRFTFGYLSGGLPSAALTVGASTGEQQYSTLRSQGVDALTAAEAGAVQGVAGAAQTFMPAARFVRPLLGDAALAIGANVGIGVAQRGSTAALLERAGYTDQAKQFAPLDQTALLTDGVLGAAFFGLGRLAARGLPDSDQIDAALTANNARNVNYDSAPGAPVDLPSEINHQRLMDHVTEQLSRGEEVTVPEWYRGEFLVRDGMEPIQPPRESVLAMAREEIGPTFRADAERMAADIIPNVRELRDEASVLSRSLDALDGEFRGRAKEFQGQRMTRKQAESAARRAIAEDRERIDGRLAEIQAQLDRNRAAESARSDLAALRRGETPESLQKAVDGRADEISQGFQKSTLARSVERAAELPPEQRVDTHISEMMRDAGLKDEARAVQSIRPEPAVDESSALIREPSSRPVQQAAGEAGAGPSRDVPARGEQGASDQLPSDLDLAREAVSRQPDIMINSGFDADGNALQSRSADVLAEIEAEHQTGVKDAQSYMAAIKCLLAG